MNLELFHDASQTPFEEEGVIDDIKERTIADLGIDEVDLAHLMQNARSMVGVKGMVKGKTPDDKLKSAVWRAMQEDPKFAMEGADQRIVYVEILRRYFPPKVEAAPTKEIASGSPVAQQAPASLEDQHRKYVEDSIERAHRDNPF